MDLKNTCQFKPTSITESVQHGGRLVVEGIYQTADQKNQNGRIYPKSVFEKNLQEGSVLMENLKRGTCLAELEHPGHNQDLKNPKASLHNVCAKHLEFWIEGDKVYGRSVILDTPAGRILKELYANGVPVGVSSRASGSVEFDEALDADIVQDDCVIKTFDFVCEPSVDIARTVPVTDSESLSRDNALEYIEKSRLVLSETYQYLGEGNRDETSDIEKCVLLECCSRDLGQIFKNQDLLESVGTDVVSLKREIERVSKQIIESSQKVDHPGSYLVGDSSADLKSRVEDESDEERREKWDKEKREREKKKLDAAKKAAEAATVAAQAASSTTEESADNVDYRSLYIAESSKYKAATKVIAGLVDKLSSLKVSRYLESLSNTNKQENLSMSKDNTATQSVEEAFDQYKEKTTKLIKELVSKVQQQRKLTESAMNYKKKYESLKSNSRKLAVAARKMNEDYKRLKLENRRLTESTLKDNKRLRKKYDTALQMIENLVGRYKKVQFETTLKECLAAPGMSEYRSILESCQDLDELKRMQKAILRNMNESRRAKGQVSGGGVLSLNESTRGNRNNTRGGTNESNLMTSLAKRGY